jgi:hypothetical protein
VLAAALYGVMIAAGVGLTPGDAEGGSIVLGQKLSTRALEREDAHDLALYLRLLEERSKDPADFDRRQPVLGQALSDLPSFWYWFDRWQKAPARFEHWHHRFWHVINGEALAKLPVSPIPPVFPLTPPTGQNPIPPMSPSPQGIGGPGVVPEPNSLVLLAVSVGLLSLALGGRRFLWG